MQVYIKVNEQNPDVSILKGKDIYSDLLISEDESLGILINEKGDESLFALEIPPKNTVL